MYAMHFIYCGALEKVRNAKYKIFFATHHFFIIFFFFLYLHGPVFYLWATAPVIMYLLERYLRHDKGNLSFSVSKVEWIPPVLAVYFKPENKDAFVFKEGQYLYLNCPYINKNEWHPFTISSAYDDLHQGPRVALETGEEVVEVPRPDGWSEDRKWHKYCPVSKDWRKLPSDQLLEKSDTDFMDYLSVHIKVHGLGDVEARSWTRKLKEYFELMNPSSPFPYYYSHRTERGDIKVGKRCGPDGQQILRVDGPQSAPAEHYLSYGTVMIIGAGIGLTPCASILTALLKYRWKKNFDPEILHFYWIVRSDEVDAFQWFIHLLTDLQYEQKRLREAGQIEQRYYCEIHIFVTGYKGDRTRTGNY